MYNCILTGRCVDIAVLCDGINDCGDTDPGSDEVEAVCSKLSMCGDRCISPFFH